MLAITRPKYNIDTSTSIFLECVSTQRPGLLRAVCSLHSPPTKPRSTRQRERAASLRSSLRLRSTNSLLGHCSTNVRLHHLIKRTLAALRVCIAALRTATATYAAPQQDDAPQACSAVLEMLERRAPQIRYAKTELVWPRVHKIFKEGSCQASPPARSNYHISTFRSAA